MASRRFLGIRGVLAVLAVMAILMALLGAGSLNARAERMSSGPLREIALFASRPVLKVSQFLRLDRPLEWADRSFRPGDSRQEAGVITPTTTTVVVSTTTRPSTTIPASTSTTTIPSLPVFSADRPLRVLVVGDSMVYYVGAGLAKTSQDLPAVKVHYVSKTSSGLAYSKYFDWPANLRMLLAQYRPHVIVVMLGANDRMPIVADGKSLRSFTPEWEAEYRGRVKSLLEISGNAGCRVVWVGLPVMRATDFSKTCRSLNSIYRGAMAEDRHAIYIDTWSMFSDDNGKYSAYLEDSSGKTRLMRAKDGIHFTPVGGERVAGAVLWVLRTHYDFE